MFKELIASRKALNLLPVAVTALGMTCQAGTIYFNGFEANTGDWTADSCVPNPGCTAGTVTRVSNGGGSLALTAPEGTHYGEITNAHEAYSFAVGPPAGYGSGGFSFFGNDGNLTVPYSGDFFQSMSVFVNTAWAAVPGEPAFWIDTAASDSGTFGTEHSFRLQPNGGTVGIFIDGSLSPLLTISSSGWYTFRITFSKGPLGTSPVSSELDILNGNTQALLAFTVLSDSTISSQLGGPGYMQIAPWKNGTSTDRLGIDAVQSGFLVPEPSTIGLVAIPLTGLLVWRRKRFRAEPVSKRHW